MIVSVYSRDKFLKGWNLLFLAALRFLTILPVGGPVKVDTALFIRSSKYYPLAGLVIGGLLWAFQRLALMAFTTELTTGLLIAFWVVMTGALHLDGLGDTLDGCYGGRTPTDRLRIMKDVHLGSMGVVGIVVLLLIKFIVLKELLLSSPPCGLFDSDPPGRPLDPGVLSRLLALRPAGRRPGPGFGPGAGEKGIILGHDFCLGNHHRGCRVAGIGAHDRSLDLEPLERLVFFP